MKFDYLIMNPPYNGNLHLKILTEALNNYVDKCINLSPVRWIQDKTARYKPGSDLNKFENEICTFIEDLSIITARDFFKLFNVLSEFDLGVYSITKKGGYDYKKLNYDSIVEKVLNTKPDVLTKHMEKDKIDGYRVRIQFLRPLRTDRDRIDASTKNRLFETCHNTKSWVYFNGINENGLHWTEDNPKGFIEGYNKDSPLPDSIPFPNKLSAYNFEQSTKTLFYRYLVYSMKTGSPLPTTYLPFLDNQVNPRTGLLGYESDWTDDDFKILYNITDDEWKKISDTIKPYI